MWFRKSKYAELIDAVENLVDKLTEDNATLKKLADKLDAQAKRQESEIKSLEMQISRKQEFIEGLFASVLDKHMAAPTVTKEAEKKDSNLVDIKQFDAATQGYIQKKLDEIKNKSNGSAKKLP